MFSSGFGALGGVTKEPLAAIVFAIASDAFAAVPTLVKSWKFPETETLDAYTTGLFNALTSFVAIRIWNFAEVAYPVYLVLVSSSLIFAILRKRIFKI